MAVPVVSGALDGRRGAQVVARGLDVEVKGKDGWTPLMVRAPPPCAAPLRSPAAPPRCAAPLHAADRHGRQRRGGAGRCGARTMRGVQPSLPPCAAPLRRPAAPRRCTQRIAVGWTLLMVRRGAHGAVARGYALQGDDGPHRGRPGPRPGPSARAQGGT